MGAIAMLAAPQLLAVSLLLEKGQVAAVSRADWSDWGAVAVLALGGYAGAYSIWYGLLRRYRVDQIAPFALLMPIMGVVASAVVLGEKPAAAALVGGVVILVGLALVVSTPRPKPAPTYQSASAPTAVPD